MQSVWHLPFGVDYCIITVAEISFRRGSVQKPMLLKMQSSSTIERYHATQHLDYVGRRASLVSWLINLAGSLSPLGSPVITQRDTGCNASLRIHLAHAHQRCSTWVIPGRSVWRLTLRILSWRCDDKLINRAGGYQLPSVFFLELRIMKHCSENLSNLHSSYTRI